MHAAGGVTGDAVGVGRRASRVGKTRRRRRAVAEVGNRNEMADTQFIFTSRSGAGAQPQAAATPATRAIVI